MKNSFLPLIVGFLLAQQCFACVGEQKVELKSRVIVSGFAGIEQNSDAVRAKLKEQIPDLKDEDIQILTKFIAKGSSVKEQTDEEYAESIKQIDEKCPVWRDVERKGRWTAYHGTGNFKTSSGVCDAVDC